MCYNNTMHIKKGGGGVDRKAYLAKLRSQNKRERAFASLGLTCSGRDLAIAFGLYLAAVVLCLFLRNIDLHQDTTYVAVIFLLDVFLTAYWTNGYVLGIITAVAGVFSVDYIFTYPYWHISFTLTGFPLTFLVMMTISVLTAAVTSRAKQTEAARREAEKEKMYADLLRAVSHDIRTPLTGIVGATNVLLEQDVELTKEQRLQLLRSTNEDAQWLIRIVENLLSITRINAEEARVKKAPEAAEEVIGSAVAKTQKHYPNVQVQVSVPDELMLVPMDPLLIEQVLVNLMENAVIHGDTSRIDVTLAQEGENAVFTVSDNGRGIPLHLLGKLFDGSARSDRSNDGKRSMGIGLSVCRTVVHAHGGTIRGENKKEGGACFTVTLPMKGDENED